LTRATLWINTLDLCFNDMLWSLRCNMQLWIVCWSETSIWTVKINCYLTGSNTGTTIFWTLLESIPIAYILASNENAILVCVNNSKTQINLKKLNLAAIKHRGKSCLTCIMGCILAFWRDIFSKNFGPSLTITNKHIKKVNKLNNCKTSIH
jgi:hypothetical protein